MRRIYPAEYQFSDDVDPEFQVLHELDLLFIPASNLKTGGEYYVVIAILGFEYAINLAGPELDGYLRWLDANDGSSCLYTGNTASQTGCSEPGDDSLVDNRGSVALGH